MTRTPGRGAWTAACAVALLFLAPAPGNAQEAAWEATPASATDRYLRALQVAGEAPLYPWSVRGFSAAEVDRLLPDSAHPWLARMRATRGGLRVLRPRAELAYNSAFPEGRNDGPVWAGRGITLAGSMGVAARWGALTVQLEPVALWAQNDDFELMDAAGPQPFADPDSPRGIDLPQRFGDGAYARVDPGQSTARVDAAGFAAGASTAVQQWGPAIDQPLLRGANAPGFAHVFVGTSAPWKVGVGRVHGRMVW
ncbi:MAG: hypothetical protein KY444_05900, partial [Gemmatimonadetes bacterium]|nr:hypothetical protein [Gemmatimonadota bacterium]